MRVTADLVVQIQHDHLQVVGGERLRCVMPCRLGVEVEKVGLEETQHGLATRLVAVGELSVSAVQHPFLGGRERQAPEAAVGRLLAELCTGGGGGE